MQYEVGVVRGNVVAMMFKQALSVWRTYRFARRQGLPADEWFGVYEKGGEIVFANCGPLPGAHERASKICDALSK